MISRQSRHPSHLLAAGRRPPGIAPRTPASGFLTSWAMTAPFRRGFTSAACSRICSSIRTRALQVVQDASELARPRRTSPHRQMERERAAISTQASDFAADSIIRGLPSGQYAPDSRRARPDAAWASGARRSARHLGLMVTKEFLRGRIDSLDASSCVDDDDAIDGRLDDRAPAPPLALSRSSLARKTDSLCFCLLMSRATDAAPSPLRDRRPIGDTDSDRQEWSRPSFGGASRSGQLGRSRS